MLDFTIEVADGAVTISINGEVVVDTAVPADFDEGSMAMDVLRSLINELECLVG